MDDKWTFSQEDSYQEKLAAGMAEGIDAYFGYK